MGRGQPTLDLAGCGGMTSWLCSGCQEVGTILGQLTGWNLQTRRARFQEVLENRLR